MRREETWGRRRAAAGDKKVRRPGGAADGARTLGVICLLCVLLFVLRECIDRGHTEGLLLDDESPLRQLQHVEGAKEAHAVDGGDALRQPDKLGERDLLLVGVIGVTAGVDIHVLEVKLGETALLRDGVREREVAESQEEIDIGVVGFLGGLFAAGVRCNLGLGAQLPDSVEVAGGVAGMVNEVVITG